MSLTSRRPDTSTLSCVSQGPISRIPSELLAEIFLCAQEDAWCQSLQVLHICHVCTHWRNVATQHFPLWTVIDAEIAHPVLIERFLTNSKVAGLCVNVALKALVNPDAMRLVTDALPRVESLSFEPEYKDTYETLKLSECWTLEYPASSLESLKLVSTTVLDNFFTSTQFPSLTHLHLNGCDFDAEALPWGQLIDLELRYLNCDVTIWDILDQLWGAPQLERLVLFSVFVIPMDQAVTARVANPIPLDALTSLVLEAMPCGSIVTFLNQVSVPSDAYISADLEDHGDDSHQDYELVVAATFQCRNESRLPAIGKLNFNQLGEASFGITNASAIGLNSGTYTSLMGLNPNSFLLVPIVESILQKHDLSYLTTLDFTRSSWNEDAIDDGADTFGLWELTRTLASIKTIIVRHVFARTFVQYLGTAMDRMKAPLSDLVHRGSTLSESECKERLRCLVNGVASNFCGLQVLSLDFRAIGWRRSGPLPLYGSSGPIVEFSSFCSGLAVRRMCGVGLKKLKLAGVDENGLAEQLRFVEGQVGQIEYPWRDIDKRSAEARSTHA